MQTKPIFQDHEVLTCSRCGAVKLSDPMNMSGFVYHPDTQTITTEVMHFCRKKSDDNQLTRPRDAALPEPPEPGQAPSDEFLARFFDS